MSEKSALRIHTHQQPQDGIVHENAQKNKRLRKHGRAPVSDNRKKRNTKIYCAAARQKQGYTDRLMRNSAIACAALLGILTLTNIDQPWAQKAADGIEKALTMRIDLDDTIGELTFVKEIMPESALVFLNISGKEQLEMPISAGLSHPWNELQPWLMFTCEQNTSVISVEAGTVTAVSPLSDGRTGLIVDHGNGLESVYACLNDVDVTSGEAVLRGQPLGTANENFYFEWRENGVPADPTLKLGL